MLWRRLLPLTFLLLILGSVALAQDDCTDNNIKEPCSLEAGRGEIIEADKAFLFVNGQGALYFRRARENRPVRGAILLVGGFSLAGMNVIGASTTQTCSSDIDALGPYHEQWSQGFHVYSLAWCKGADDIRRNSLVFEKALELVRSGAIATGASAELEDTQPVVVIGGSMGGLVSRHALARMEKEGKPHGVSLFISFDSPQEGAYLPIGIQSANDFILNLGTNSILASSVRGYLVDALKGLADYALSNNPITEPGTTITINEGAAQIVGMDTIASKQMLLVHHTSLFNRGPNLERIILEEELDDLGYPDQLGLKTVAISNGNGTGWLKSPRPLRGFGWQSDPWTLKLKTPIRIENPTDGETLWSTTIEAKLKVFVDMEITPLTQNDANQEVFHFHLSNRPKVSIGGVDFEVGELPSVSDLVDEWELSETVATIGDGILADALEKITDWIDDTLNQVRDYGVTVRSDSPWGYERGGAGTGLKYKTFDQFMNPKDDEGKSERSGTFTGGTHRETFIPVRSALGLTGDPAAAITEQDIENSPFDQVYFHTKDSGHVDFDDAEPQETDDVWTKDFICQEVNDVIGKPFMTGISPTTRPVQGSEFTLTVEGSNFNQSSVVMWDTSNNTPAGQTALATTFISPEKLEALVPAQLISELTPCATEDENGDPLPNNICGNPSFPGIRDPVVIEVSTPDPPAVPHIPARRSPTTHVCEQELNFGIQIVSLPNIEPMQPTSLDVIRASYSGDWRDGCVPMDPVVSVNGDMIDVVATGEQGFCNFEFAPYTLDFEVGTLAAGEYRMDIIDDRPFFSNPNTEISTSAFTVRNPQPVITGLNPGFVPAKSGDGELRVIGSGFIDQDSTVLWNGQPLETTWESNSSLLAVVPASKLSAEGTAKVKVSTIDPIETRVSNEVEATIGIPDLVLTQLQPSSVPYGSPDTVIQFSGDGFDANTRVMWSGPNGAEFYLQTSVASRNSLTATLPATELQLPSVHLFTLERDGAESDDANFNVTGENDAVGIPIAAAVTNGASFDLTVAPGSLASLFGWNLSPGIDAASSFPLPTELLGVRVLVNGVEAPLLYVSENQINFQVPFDVPLGAVVVAVVRDGVQGPSGKMTVSAGAFGAFQYNRVPESLDPVILHQVGGVVSPANPAVANEVLTMYGTGAGPLTNAPPTGAPSAGSPLARCEVLPQAFLSGGAQNIQVAVEFCGLTPNFAGLIQVNIRMPATMPPGPVTLVLVFDEKTLNWPLATQ